MKYYVESGDIKYVIQAKTPMHACMRALNRESTKMRDVRLESNFFVYLNFVQKNFFITTYYILNHLYKIYNYTNDKYFKSND